MLPEVGIEYVEYTDGTCSGQIVGVSGEIFANDEQTFFFGVNWLVSQIIGIEEATRARGGGIRMADLGMEGQWIEGEFCVRFLKCPGWGVAFKTQGDLQKWFTHILKVVIRPKTVKTND